MGLRYDIHCRCCERMADLMLHSVRKKSLKQQAVNQTATVWRQKHSVEKSGRGRRVLLTYSRRSGLNTSLATIGVEACRGNTLVYSGTCEIAGCLTATVACASSPHPLKLKLSSTNCACHCFFHFQPAADFWPGLPQGNTGVKMTRFQ